MVFFFLLCYNTFGDIMLICPICKEKLQIVNNSYKCINNHSFDISKSGYTNLLISKTNSGDNQEMVNARFIFLNKGYYKNLALKIKELTQDLPKDFILDAGCGTGYYSSFLKDNNIIYGYDISKYAINKASKTYKDNKYFVASSNNIPISNNSVDILLSIFAPTFANEFYRVLKNSGYFILVGPGKYHLYELKEKIYDNPYLNEEKDYKLDNFTLVNKENLKYQVLVDSLDILPLLEMTPYFYKTNPDDIKKINVSNLNITLDFTIEIYKKRL